MQAQLAERQRKLVTIVDPHIKKDSGYYIYKEAEAGNYLTKNKDGSTYDGCASLLPASCMKPQARASRAWLLMPLVDSGQVVLARRLCVQRHDEPYNSRMVDQAIPALKVSGLHS